MENDRIVKRVYMGGRLVDRPRKRWIDSVNDFEFWVSKKDGVG